ncbi:MAG: type II toxin-antitoxin system VapC family toxin [Chloracidobacterium sp.]|nr:type II toxin-antitoxin system VapC family toxin [Chloracidobacterium sp.]
MRIVIDASVLIKWYVAETDFAQEAEYLTDDSFDLHAPQLILAEIGNILWKKYSRGELDESQVLRILRESDIDRELVLHSHQPLVEEAVKCAMETRQTVYDWMYLTLALALDIQFVTADAKFFNNVSQTKYSNHLCWIGDVRQLV